jgi:ABC-type amino acid transport substrate-binding protein
LEAYLEGFQMNRAITIRALLLLVLVLCFGLGGWAQEEQGRDVMLELTAEEKAFLAEHPVLRLSGDPDWLPLESFTRSGEYQGIVPDYLELIAKHSGLSFEVVPSSSWGRTWRWPKSERLM